MPTISQILSSNKIDHTILEYEEVLGTAEEAAEKLGWELSQIIKTLVIKGKKNGFYIALVPGNRSIDWSKLAKSLEEKKVHMASYDEVTEQTGYVVGSVSPLGTTNKLPVIMDPSILDNSHIGINGGTRGIEIRLKPSSLCSIVEAEVLDICK